MRGRESETGQGQEITEPSKPGVQNYVEIVSPFLSPAELESVRRAEGVQKYRERLMTPSDKPDCEPIYTWWNDNYEHDQMGVGEWLDLQGKVHIVLYHGTVEDGRPTEWKPLFIFPAEQAEHIVHGIVAALRFMGVS